MADEAIQHDVRSLTGYTNDVVKGGQSYHILTEDLGEHYALIVTQTFCAGSIVATRKTHYPTSGDHEARRAVVKRLMQAQHKAAMRALVTRRESGSLPPDSPLVVAAQHTPSMGLPPVGHPSVAELVPLDHAAILEVMGGPLAHERLSLCATPLSLGRDAALVIDDPELADRQALLVRKPEGWVVTTHGRGAAVLVNGQPITARALEHGDRIDLGRTALLFLEDAALGAVARHRSPLDARPHARLQPSLLPLVLAALSTPRPLLVERALELEQAAAALAHVGPQATPSLFDDAPSQLAYHLDALAALARLGIAAGDAFDGRARRTLDGRSLGLVELDRLVCERCDSRVYAAIALALRSDADVSFTGEDLEAELDGAMEAMVNDPAQVRIEHEARRVVLPAEAWPFLGLYEAEADGSAIERLRHFGGPRRAAELGRAAAQDFDVVFLR